MAIFSALIFLFIGILPTNLWLLRPLEYRYGTPELPPHVDGILTLGGGLDYRIRMAGAFMLARQYPNAKVVYSGGSGNLFDNVPGQEAEGARAYLLKLGLDPHRLILETLSRNTWENLTFTKALVRPKPGEIWILAISAMQLPRAMQTADQVHWKMIPWATESRATRFGFHGYFEIPENMWAFDNAVREWIGLFAYRLLRTY